jgi:hypothetical protein
MKVIKFDEIQNFVVDNIFVCHTRFWNGTECISYVRQDQVYTHMIGDTSVYPKQCYNEKEYYSTLLRDRKS